MPDDSFCRKCGADATTNDCYCKRCGEWLPNPAQSLRPGLLRQRTRDEIRKMRVMEVASAGLSLVAAASIAVVLITDVDLPLLVLAVLCCSAVAAFQVVAFFLTQERL